MDAKELLVIVLYIGLITLVIVSIVLMFRLIKTLNKVEKVVDDAYDKVGKLNGLFNIIDTTTDAIASFSNLFVEGISNGISKIFTKKKGKKKDE